MRSRLVIGGAVAATVLGVLVLLVTVLTPSRPLPWPRTSVVIGGLVAVVAVAVAVLGARRRNLAARRAAWFAIPALVLGWTWWWQPLRTIGWFAYAPLSSVVVDGPPASDALLPALVLLLWTLTTTGAVTVVGHESPVRVLAVVAMALTAPLWFPPGPRITDVGAALSAQVVSTEVVVVRTAALLLVLAIGAAVLVDGRPAPALATAAVVPAVGLSWVWWQTGAGARASVALAGGLPEPGFSDLLPWAVTPVAETALVIALWVLTFLGVRVLLAVPVNPPAR